MFKIGSERAGVPHKAAAISLGVLAAVTPLRALFLALSIALSIALLAGCGGGRVGGQSGSEGCMPEDDLFRAQVADGGFEDEDAGPGTTSLMGDEPEQCPAEP
jgi:hypothetical protein